MATKLNQIIAVEKGVKATTARAIQDAQHLVQRPDAFQGIARSYRPKEDGGETMPSQSTKVQVRAEGLLETVGDFMTRFLDVTATKDWANCEAKGSVAVDGETILSDVPVTYLIFLEKQLGELRNFIARLPVLDAADEWEFDETQDCYRTNPVETARPKKTMHNHVRYEATKEHPAQVDVYTEDVVVGYWTTIKYSGATTQRKLNTLLERVDALVEAIKFAREEANSIEVRDVHVGAAVFNFILA